MSDKPNGTNGTMTEQEVEYVAQVLAQRPLAESLALWLKLTGQEIVKAGPPAPPPAG
jgi:hypothetical protein